MPGVLRGAGSDLRDHAVRISQNVARGPLRATRLVRVLHKNFPPVLMTLLLILSAQQLLSPVLIAGPTEMNNESNCLALRTFTFFPAGGDFAHPLSWDIFGCPSWGERVLLTSCAWRPGKMLNVLRCTGVSNNKDESDPKCQ